MTPHIPSRKYTTQLTQEGNRAPGRDGLSFEFYRAARTIMGDYLNGILNTIFFGGAITPQQKLGTIFCPQARPDSYAG